MITENITDCELLVMKVLWETKEELSLPGIVDEVNTKNHKDWKPQTVSTFLSRLVKKGYLKMQRRGRIFLYEPMVSEDDYGSAALNRFVEFWLDGDAGKLPEYLAKNRKWKKAELDSLKKFVEKGK